MSAVMTTEVRRLPGVSFETLRPDAVGRLPRMDVAAFVGLASAGPFDVPVRVEEPLRFRELFGDDLELTTATTDADAARSALGPTVEAFFANGGRACWVVRVGARDEAERSLFPVPGLVDWHVTGPRPATVAARSAGSAFDGVRVAGTAVRRPVVIRAADAVVAADRGSLAVATAGGVERGQLLELTWADGTVLWVPIGDVTTGDFGRLVVSWSGAAHWFRRADPGERPLGASHRLSGDGGSTPLSSTTHRVDADGRSTLSTTTAVGADRVGDLVVRSMAGGVVEVFVVDDVRTTAGRSELRSTATWQQLAAAAVPPPTAPAAASIVTLGLAAFEGDTLVAEQRGLDAAEAGRRWWGGLPTDEAHFGAAYRRATSDGEHPASRALDDDVARPRFPLAAHAAPPLVLPLGLDVDPLTATRSSVVEHAAPATTRDGVRRLDRSWFVDDEMAVHGPRTLDHAARRRFFVDGLPLRGLHAVLPIDEVAVLSVPDATHTGWTESTVVPPLPLTAPALAIAEEPPEGTTIEWTVADTPSPDDRFEVDASEHADFVGPPERQVTASSSLATTIPGCEPRWFRVRTVRGGRRSGWSNSVLIVTGGGAFDPCDLTVGGVPVLELADASTITWHLVPSVDGGVLGPAPVAYELESASDPDFVTAERRELPVPTVGDPAVEIDPGPLQATWFRVRVRPEVGAAAGPWSRTLVVGAAPRTVRVATGSAGAVAPVTTSVHRAMAAATAARQDLTALVSFPDDYGLDQIAAHLAEVRAGGDLGPDLRSWVDLLHAHHPWIASASAAAPVWSPPDGAVAGRMAHRALTRGAWISAAGLRLDGVVDAGRRLDLDDVLDLRDHRVNAVTPDRAGFVVVGNDTLAADHTLAPVTVRRLLILIRRLVRRDGRVMVFENNGPVLWSVIRCRFERLLGEMFRRGAFAGATPSEAYRVICDRSVNPPSSIDAGRLVVELQVAPSQPLEFLRVRFVQTDSVGPDLLEIVR